VLLENNMEEIKKSIESIKSNADSINKMITDIVIDSTLGDLEDNVVTFSGKFSNNDDTESKFMTDFSVNNLINQDTENIAKTLTAIGNVERFKIIELLFEKGRTVNEILKALNFKTTGKVYHHLNILIASGLVFKCNDDRYRIKATHVQGVLAMLVGCSCFLRHGNK